MTPATPKLVRGVIPKGSDFGLRAFVGWNFWRGGHGVDLGGVSRREGRRGEDRRGGGSRAGTNIFWWRKWRRSCPGIEIVSAVAGIPSGSGVEVVVVEVVERDGVDLADGSVQVDEFVRVSAPHTFIVGRLALVSALLVIRVCGHVFVVIIGLDLSHNSKLFDVILIHVFLELLLVDQGADISQSLPQLCIFVFQPCQFLLCAFRFGSLG